MFASACVYVIRARVYTYIHVYVRPGNQFSVAASILRRVEGERWCVCESRSKRAARGSHHRRVVHWRFWWLFTVLCRHHRRRSNRTIERHTHPEMRTNDVGKRIFLPKPRAHGTACNTTLLLTLRATGAHQPRGMVGAREIGGLKTVPVHAACLHRGPWIVCK